jgi:hypothetical protein
MCTGAAVPRRAPLTGGGEFVPLDLDATDNDGNPMIDGNAHSVLLWFQIGDFDSVMEQARGLRGEVVEEPHVNPALRTGGFGCATRWLCGGGCQPGG